MTSSRIAAITLGLAACARAGAMIDDDVDAPPRPDGSQTADAPPGSIDAPPCATTMANILTNPNFDLTPIATGWTETRINGETIIRGDSAIIEHTAPTLAWLGGIPQTNATDAIDQTIMIPQSTTMITLSGQYDVRSSDTVPNIDTATMGLFPASGTTPLGPTVALTNSMTTTAWTPFNLTIPVTAALAGQTVRMRLTSTSGNAVNPTSFYVDSLELEATFCPP